MLSTFLSQIVNGLVLGSLIGLIALGYTMVYGIIQLINFAHGEIFMVGAFGGLFMFTYLLPTFVQQQWYLALAVCCSSAAQRSRCWSRCHGALRLPAAARRPPARSADHRAGRLGGAPGGGPDLLPGRARPRCPSRACSSQGTWVIPVPAARADPLDAGC